MIQKAKVRSERPDVRSLIERERTDVGSDERPVSTGDVSSTNTERPDERPTNRPDPFDLAGRFAAAVAAKKHRQEQKRITRQLETAGRVKGKQWLHARKLQRNHANRRR